VPIRCHPHSFIVPNYPKKVLKFSKISQKTPNKQGVCRTVALPFTLKSILKQKKNYGNSNIAPCKNVIFKKSSKSFKIL
jgi:hypothetical protein